MSFCEFTNYFCQEITSEDFKSVAVFIKRFDDSELNDLAKRFQAMIRLIELEQDSRINLAELETSIKACLKSAEGN